MQKLDAVSAFGTQSSGLSFGKLSTGAEEKVRRELCKLFASRHRRTVTIPVSSQTLAKGLQLMSMGVYGSETGALLDFGPMSNAMNRDMAALLLLVPERTSTKMSVANGLKAVCPGALEYVPVQFGKNVARLHFLW